MSKGPAFLKHDDKASVEMEGMCTTGGGGGGGPCCCLFVCFVCGFVVVVVCVCKWMYLWWSLCTLYFTHMPGVSYRRRLRSLLLCLSDV